MNKIRLKYLFVVLVFITFCVYAVREKESEYSSLDTILKHKEITVITLNNAHCYYFYKDQPMGFEYELAKAYAEYLGVKLRVQVVEKPEDLIPALKKNKYAFIAANIKMASKRKKEVAFSDSYMNVRQCIIVRKNNAGHIQNKKDLEGQIVHVRKGSTYEDQLKKLKEQGINLKIVSCKNSYDEELIEKVAQKKIKITIAYSNIANLNRRYYPQINIAGAISDYEPLGWAVESNSKSLLLSINNFFKKIKKNGKYDSIRNRYYSGIDSFDNTEIILFYVMMKTRFPAYSQIIKEASTAYGFDWRLITAMAYQESRFDPFAQSYAGAYGFMQITPETAISLGSTNVFDPEQNIYTGLKHLKNLYNYYSVSSQLNRMLIALAAYNVGEGHISDAMDLAVKQNINPNTWASIAKVLPLLSEQRYYSKAKYGYCRGSETVDYINQIMHYYEILKKDAIKHKKKHRAGNIAK